ncbi:DNA-3-methyladenine glycosylase I [Vibrio salinus]|uniref:DNA-3-methyladenine glycosylase I n=1 Tax=Vibrio salinus TaxID=2899784 RepID=UPI001E4D4979|nr:DNA-3-methyladenine glycosylase I [Vibrio salinus]MCE0492644.1 DNA-3-methyladenine glycosylase I [Vibrio salinus]
MEKKRCPWLDLSKTDYVKYHDKEWGVPVYDDRTLFEFVILESAQAGLSWYTILRRREGYRKAFDNFEPSLVANYDAEKVEQLVNNSEIIRHRGKIQAAIGNAKVFLAIQNEFGSFSRYLWEYVGGKPVVLRPERKEDFQVTSELSDQISLDLKMRGFKFFGSTICYSYLQACGLINEHSIDCFCAQKESETT